MSKRTLPLLFINLGGEMMYILDQRLHAQGIESEKAQKVIDDIVGTMFNKRFMEELFKPQEVYSKKGLRTVFDRLAHASIMRLNTASMDKLYDLMTMAFKYQVSLAMQPRDVVLITLNHLDAIRHFVRNSPAVESLVDNVYAQIIKDYATMSHGDYLLIRQTLMVFFQDIHIRVSIFLKDKVQCPTGRFVLHVGGPVPWGTDPPGKIKLFTSTGMIGKTVEFDAKAIYQSQSKQGSIAVKGDRVTKLGINMYNVAKPLETSAAMHATQTQASRTSLQPALESRSCNVSSTAQLDLLARLITPAATVKNTEFRLNLFNTDEEESTAEKERPAPVLEEGHVIKIDARKCERSAELNRIMGELTIDGGSSSHDDDLLALMDQA